MSATLEVLITAQDQASKVMSSVQANAKKMGVGMVAAGAAITGTMALSVKSYAAAGDEVAKMAKRTGFSTEALSELKYAAELSGGSLQGIEKGSRRLASAIQDSKDGLTESIRAFDTLGLSWEDLATQSPEDQMLAVLTALSDMDDASTQAALAQDLLGRAGTSMLPMLWDGAEGLEEMRKEAHEMGVVFDKEAAEKAELMTDEMLRVKESIRGVTNAIAENLIPAITPMTDKISGAVTKVSRWMNENKSLSRALVTVTAAVGAILIPLGTMLILLPKLVAGIMAFKTAIAVIKSLTAAQWLWNIALNANPIGLVVIAVAGLVAWLALLWKAWDDNRAIALVLTYVLSMMFGPIGPAVILVIKNWDKVKAALNTLKEGFMSFVGKLKEIFTPIATVVTAPFRVAVAAIKLIVDKLKDPFVSFVSKIKDIMSPIADFVTAPFRLSFNAVRAMYNAMIGHISGKTLFNLPKKEVMGQTVFPGWKLVLPKLPTIPALAEGGIVRKPTLAMIGEGGPEAVVPLGKNNMGMQVHFHVGAMMGTEHEAREFARMINTYVFEEARLGGY